MTDDNGILLEISGIKKYYHPQGGKFWEKSAMIRAVDNVSMKIRLGETMGLVGESGCGKSTLAKLIMGLEKPTAGEIRFKGETLSTYSQAAWREFRNKVQIIFQDPYASLNPRRTAGKTVGEPLYIRRKELSKREINDRTGELLKLVGLGPEHRDRYPHEFSGGQRQRIGIARAIAVKPALVIADEPVSALDVSIQAQILNLLKDLQDELRLTYLFISHNMAVIRHMSDRISVMYLGKIVETGTNEEIFKEPWHPYTRLLLSAILETRPKSRVEKVKETSEPKLMRHPEFCRFLPRCPIKTDQCLNEAPPLVQITETHAVACHFGANNDMNEGPC